MRKTLLLLMKSDRDISVEKRPAFVTLSNRKIIIYWSKIKKKKTMVSVRTSKLKKMKLSNVNWFQTHKDQSHNRLILTIKSSKLHSKAFFLESTRCQKSKTKIRSIPIKTHKTISNKFLTSFRTSRKTKIWQNSLCSQNW